MPGALSAILLLLLGETFQDPQWMPEAVHSAQPLCAVFLPIHTPWDEVEFLSEAQENMGHSRTRVTIHCHKSSRVEGCTGGLARSKRLTVPHSPFFLR